MRHCKSMSLSLPLHIDSSHSGHRVYQEGHFVDVTIIDLESGLKKLISCSHSFVNPSLCCLGVLKPSRRLQFSSMCTLSSTGGVVPEADPILLKELVDQLRDMGKAVNTKPPIPARYRFFLFQQLNALIGQQDAKLLYPPPFRLQGRSAPQLNPPMCSFSTLFPLGINNSKKSSMLSILGHVLSKTVFDIMVSLFKGLLEYVNLPQDLTSV